MGEKAKELSLDITAEWDRSVPSLLELQDTSRTAAVHTYSTNPALPSWELSICVTVLGNAAHVIPPSATFWGGGGASRCLNTSEKNGRGWNGRRKYRCVREGVENAR